MMNSTQSISVDLPEELYERIREVAERYDRSVESVLRESLEVMFGKATADPENLHARLETYRDDQLWAVVYQRLTWHQQARLEELIAQGKTAALTSAEQTELKTLLEQVDRYMVLRSHALRLLQQRGHAVEQILKLKG